MTDLFSYEGKLVRVTDQEGRKITGTAVSFPSGYGLHEYNREEDGLQVGEYVLFKSQIAQIECRPTYEEAVESIRPGRYRHFKGKEYEVIGIARPSLSASTLAGQALVLALTREAFAIFIEAMDLSSPSIANDELYMKQPSIFRLR